jgi:hypothetical protein
MQIIKTWHEQTFPLGGGEVRLKLKALPYGSEAKAFIRTMGEYAKEAQKLFASTERVSFADQLEVMETAYGGEFARQAFAKYVRPAEPMETDDGKKLDTGEAILDELGTPGFVQAVLVGIQMLAMLSGQQGKASSSPATSSSAPTGDSGSAVTPTEPEDGIAH